MFRSLSDFEFLLLKRVFLGLTLVYAATFSFAVFMQSVNPVRMYVHHDLILALRSFNVFINLVGLGLYWRYRSRQKAVMTLALVLSLFNFLVVQFIQVFLVGNRMLVAMQLMFSPMFLIILGFFTQRMVSRVIFAAFLLGLTAGVLFGLPGSFFSHRIELPDLERDLVIIAVSQVTIALAIILLNLSVSDRLFRQFRKTTDYLKDLAYRDHESGLPNGLKLTALLEKEVQNWKTGDPLLFLAGLRLDGINEMNEKLGFEATNRWLAQFASELVGILHGLREKFPAFGVLGEEILYRAEAGIFLIPGRIIPSKQAQDPISPQELRDAVENLLLRTPQGLEMGFSGIFSIYPNDAASAAQLQRNVLYVLYRHNPAHQRQFTPFDVKAYRSFLRQEQIKEFCVSPSFRRELSVVFQPKVAINDNLCVGFEALVRWTHPELGAVPPVEFIPLAERCQAIEIVTDEVLEQTFLFIEKLCAEGANHFHVSFNLSPVLLTRSYLTRLVDKVSRKGLGKYLEVEITEGVLMKKDPVIDHAFGLLRILGVWFAIDDFGTGYSNLSYLQNFDADVLKIDKRFVDGLPLNEKNSNLIKAIVQLAKTFDQRTVAEGVESEAQARFLTEAGCGAIQGFLFARPLEPEAALEFYRKKNQNEKTTV